MGSICFFNTAVAWGGGEKWHFEVSQHLHNKGIPVFVVAHSKSILLEKLKKTDIPHKEIALSNLSFINPLKIVLVRNILKTCIIDSIVMNLSSDVKIAGPIAKSLNIPRVIYRRGSAIPIKDTFLNRYLFKKVLTEILANSIATKKTVLEYNPKLFPNEKITVIYNGVKVPKLPKTDNHPEKNKTITLINIGRLEHQKNQGFLLDVAKKLLQKGIDFKLLIGGEGRLHDELQSRINNEGLSKNVELRGFIEKPYDFISMGDVFLLSSHWEGFGYVLAEAALCGKPSIAFNISSNPEVVVHQKTGILTPPNNIDSFVEAIETFAKDKSLIEKMGVAARAFAVNQFEKSKKLREIEAYLIDE
ncbi:glycosyltransferase [Zobellia russellii]|uniref:glycosyltransferase n=1 Tax=Zobellia russellii TaxID=248907 RepID=UPI001BFF0F24|nr:glycosyltransferase [Zobellia russellii]MBT9190171.1 glycosyltransferase [Zobellia russellii]